MLLILCIGNIAAQNSSRFSAFMTCFDEDGSAELCAVDSWFLAEGFTGADQSEAASLRGDPIDSYTDLDICQTTPAPASITVSLENSDLEIGDRIQFQDFAIGAFHTNDTYLPETPIRIDVISQEGMLSHEPDQDFIEITSFGMASFIVSFYCELPFDVSSSVQITVEPEI